MTNQRFGIEIELTGITRKDAAKVIASFYGTTEVYVDGAYKAYITPIGNGRNWSIVRDASINPERKDGTCGTDEMRTEVVSPICTLDDLENIQEIVRQLRKKGAIANGSCGIHVHVDAAPHNARSIRNIVTSKEDILFKALGVSQERAERWCRKVETDFVEKINKKKPTTTNQIEAIWYNGDCRRASSHYDPSRYHALNLHAI